MKLLYNEEELFCTTAELLNFKITLPLAKLDVVGTRLVSNDLKWFEKSLNFSADILVDIQVEIFLLLSNVSDQSIGAKNEKFW